MGISLLIFFFQLFGAIGSIGQISIAHITFCISYVAVTVRARASGMDPELEEAARDLGASAWGAFRYVTVPLILPAVIAGAMLAFALSFDDLVVTSFNDGVGSATLPIYIYSSIKFGVTPEINAISTIIVAVVSIILFLRGGSGRSDRPDRRSRSRTRPRPEPPGGAYSRGAVVWVALARAVVRAWVCSCDPRPVVGWSCSCGSWAAASWACVASCVWAPTSSWPIGASFGTGWS